MTEPPAGARDDHSASGAYPPRRDPARRQPIVNLPLVVVLLIGAFVAVQGWRELIDTETDYYVLRALAFVPGRLTFAFDPDAVATALSGLTGPEAQDMRVTARFFLGDGAPHWETLVTYAFLHGNWTHLILNSIWLGAFGAPVARRFGAFRFGVFFLVAAVCGALTHWLVHTTDLEPVIGASASVSAAIAAATRFVFQPGAPLGRRLDGPPFDPLQPYRMAALPLAGIFRERRVASFVGLWFVLNFAFGVAALPFGLTDSGVAWEAHIGGFLAGLLLFGLFDPVRRDPPPLAAPDPADDSAA